MFPTLRRRSPVQTKAVEAINWSTPDGSMPSWLAGRRRRNHQSVEQAVYGAYEKTVWLWRGLSFMAGQASRLPFRYRLPGTETWIDDHPIAKLLQPHTKVNPLERGRAFRRRLFLQAMLLPTGAFVELVRSRGGDIIRLDLLPPHRTRPVPAWSPGSKRVPKDNLISHFEVRMPDGSVRDLAPEQVWWVREPHPIDPFRADTVLAPLGLSVEMDDLGRQINVNWMLNDGQVKAIVGVKGGLNPADSAKLESRFGRGPVDAGLVSVVNADQVTYADVSARPRDMQYEELARHAKEEILGGLGVPESLLGNTKGTTFDNAAQDRFNFWSETMPGPLELVAAELVDPNDDRDLEPVFYTGDVDALKLPQQKQREEARLEVAAGLRPIESYAELAGIEVFSTPETRGLWVPNTGKLQVPQTAADVAEAQKQREEMAALMQPADDGADGAENDLDSPAPAPGSDTAAGGGRNPRAAGGTSGSARQAGGGQGRAAADSGRNAGADGKNTSPAAGVSRYRVAAVKTAGPVRTAASGGLGRADEDAVTAAMAALTTRWTARTIARLRSPKTRKGTRHWLADPGMPVDGRVGGKTLDIGGAVDADLWEQETIATVGPLLNTAAAGAAVATLTTLTGVPATADGPTTTMAAVASAAAEDAVKHLGQAAREFAVRFAGALTTAEQAGADLDTLVAHVSQTAGRLIGWAKTAARHAAAVAVTGGMHAAGRAARAAGFEVSATWQTVHDGHVRPSHKEADGQTRPAAGRFEVGDALLRFPRDPAGPVAETANCRCELKLSARRVTAAPA